MKAGTILSSSGVEVCWLWLSRCVLKLNDLRALTGGGHNGLEVTSLKLPAVITSLAGTSSSIVVVLCVPEELSIKVRC